MPMRYRVLDSGPLDLACARPNRPEVRLIYLCITVLWPEEGVTVVIPEIADYEVRRKLINIGSMNSLGTLNALRNRLFYLPINTRAMHRAADLWARARKTGQQTAHDRALDGDVILAAQALEYIGLGDDLVIITDNNRHLGRFDVKTSSWQAYSPSPPPMP